MKKTDESSSWLQKLKQFFCFSPSNQAELVKVLHSAQEKNLITSDTMLMLEGAVLFSSMRARDLMIPRKQMVCIQKSDNFENIIDKVLESGHSRFPVMDDHKEFIIGIFHAKDLLYLQNKKNFISFNMLDHCRQAVFIPESKKLDSLLREFRQNKNHMAIVVNEYGSIAGLVTMEDVIEQIVGDIEDEFDIEKDPYIRQHPDFHYTIKGHTPIIAFNELLHTSFNHSSYDTIGGIVMNHFGYLPTRGESIHIADFLFTVLSADARHIKLLECVDQRRLSNEVLAAQE